ncbi:hypothetical protein [Domibacillus iocasae]|uniref:DUF2634 domain-containing protein n=1 Tax=Domibacillus iocasae TaxID=1714016 RepID=A0A1E7DQ61_9BACI|nr:hypothetical protein [Domibacillus iocasae]OES45222.1 hypothetical protein BA724_04230 [Domibacillus iocasae]
MKDILLDDSSDLLFEKGDFVLGEDEQELKQSLYINLATNKGEWFLDVEAGLSFKSITGKPTDAQIRAAVIEALAQEPRVTLIQGVQIEQDRKNRKVMILFKVQTTEGVVEDEVMINGA